MKRSAGILPFRMKDGRLEVFLGRFGGPFWKKRRRSWGIIKGEVEEGESDLEAAKREFFEETRKRIEGDFIDLGEVKTSNKIVHVYAVKADLDTDIQSNEVQMEYRGRVLRFPEIEEARWFGLDEAKKRIVKSQAFFLDRLSSIVA